MPHETILSFWIMAFLWRSYIYVYIKQVYFEMDMLGFSFLVFIINLFMKISNITSVSSFTPPEKPLLTFMILLFGFFFRHSEFSQVIWRPCIRTLSWGLMGSSVGKSEGNGCPSWRTQQPLVQSFIREIALLVWQLFSSWSLKYSTVKAEICFFTLWNAAGFYKYNNNNNI